MADRHEMLQKISEVSFAVNDLTLYLDTHPTDEQAKADYSKFVSERKQLMQEFAEEFYPLTNDCLGQYRSWEDGATPWEGGHI